MNTAILLACELPGEWEQVRAIRKTTKQRLAHYGEAVSSACAMVAAELVENALKYGEPVEGLVSGQYCLEDRDGEVRITVLSGCTRPAKIAELARHLQRIREVEDKGTLYEERARELLLDETQSGGLGLYRIAFEGQFHLGHDYRDQRLAMIATRRPS